MEYVSTRGAAPSLSFADVVLAGLARDGGLYVPAEIPQFSAPELVQMASLSYTELAFRVMRPFTGDALSDEALRGLIVGAYCPFRHTAIAPLTQIGHNRWVLELFHGPTLAFKDFALQFLGGLLDHLLTERGQSVTVVGATSGDTGSAAIEGCRGRSAISTVIFHPYGRVSDVQRRQMTTVHDTNIHNIALEGTFDDCQNLVKALFNDHAFRDEYRLAAVNSINWARILAQVVYYFYAALGIGAPARTVSFSVPTGNFGDIYAGYIAKRMGLPVTSLIVATNRNDILTRCLNAGDYSMKEVVPSLSPSMDIQISSNFERLLFDCHGRDGGRIGEMMEIFQREKRLSLDPQALSELRRHFRSASVGDNTTRKVIKDIYETTGALLDPHTAIGVEAARLCEPGPETPVIALATAHPAKFPDTVMEACGVRPPLPLHLQDLLERDERYDVLPNDIGKAKHYIRSHCA